ncbi:MAG: PLP-dependent aminotransferase family protein, partial [Arthrobacter sp.]|uniref:MocR-like pyridoxine biosynthesis transcription factor PdxR n=1 Tax=Arthrobacter sp. TaxID=1667 RepID=UPI0034944D01
MAVAELPIMLDRADRTPLAAQLAGRLRQAILDGTLRAEDSLPSSRGLATNLGISRGVVVRAFEQLTGEGYLEGRGAAGTRVAVRPDLPRPAPPPGTAPRGEPPRTLIDLTPGRPSAQPFRDRAWRAAWRSAVPAHETTALPPALGVPALRAAIAAHLASSRGVLADPGDVIVTAGTSDALQLLVTALRAGSARPRILVEDPGYPTARRVLSAAGATVEPLPVGPDGLRADQLASLPHTPDAVLVTPSHQYPLGGRMPIGERLALLAWATENNVLVLEDDYDSEFRHRRMPLPAVASLPSQAEVVLVGTFSKTLSPWLRCGYLVVRGDAGRTLKNTRLDLDTPVSGTLQTALAHYIDGGGLARHTARARREYAHRRRLLLERLGPREDVDLTALDGGLHAVLRFGAGTDADQLAAALHQRGIRVPTLAHYYAGRPPANGLVIGYGAPTDLELTQALDTLLTL